jgi:hypothetical protein
VLAATVRHAAPRLAAGRYMTGKRCGLGCLTRRLQRQREVAHSIQALVQDPVGRRGYRRAGLDHTIG